MKRYITFVTAICLLSATSTLYAESDVKVTPYASIRLMIQDNENSDDPTGQNALSRFGIKGSQTVSPGLEFFGGIEYGVDADDTNSDPSLRLGFAGLKGAWGQLSFGAQTQVWHKFVRGAKFNDGVDSLRLGAIRDQDSLQFFGKIRKVNIGISRSFEGDGNEHTQVAAAIPFKRGDKFSGKVSVALQQDQEGTLLGLRPEATFGKSHITLLYYQADADFTAHGANLCGDGGDTVSAGIYLKQELQHGFQIHGRFMNYSCDVTEDGDSVKLELVKKFNKKARIWLGYETGEGGNVVDQEAQLGIRYDI